MPHPVSHKLASLLMTCLRALAGTETSHDPDGSTWPGSDVHNVIELGPRAAVAGGPGRPKRRPQCSIRRTRVSRDVRRGRYAAGLMIYPATCRSEPGEPLTSPAGRCSLCRNN